MDNIFCPPREHTCCFTGHRSLSRIEEERLRALLPGIIADNIGRGIRHYYAGGALGFDMIAAEAVLDAMKAHPQITLHLALPCGDYNVRWSRWQRDKMARIIEASTSAVYLARAYYGGCMFQRNRYMVEHSGYCIAYLAKNSGGTYQTVAYAKRRGLPVMNLGG